MTSSNFNNPSPDYFKNSLADISEYPKNSSKITSYANSLTPLEKSTVKKIYNVIKFEKTVEIPTKSIIIVMLSIITSMVLLLQDNSPLNVIASTAFICPGYMHGKRIIQFIRSKK